MIELNFKNTFIKDIFILILVFILSINLFSYDQNKIIQKVQDATNSLQAKNYEQAIDEANEILKIKGLDREFQGACYLVLYEAYKETHNSKSDKYKSEIENFKDTEAYKQFQEIYGQNKPTNNDKDSFTDIERLIIDDKLTEAQEQINKLKKENPNLFDNPRYLLLQYNIYVKKGQGYEDKVQKIKDTLEKANLSDQDLIKFYSMTESVYLEKEPEKAKEYKDKTNELIRKVFSNNKGYRSDIMERKDDLPLSRDPLSTEQENKTTFPTYLSYLIIGLLLIIIIFLIVKLKKK